MATPSGAAADSFGPILGAETAPQGDVSAGHGGAGADHGPVAGSEVSGVATDIARGGQPVGSAAVEPTATGGNDGQVVLVATPIGNIADASLRMRHLLESATVVAAEDTRRVRALAARLGVSPHAGQQVVSCHDHNERSRAQDLVAVAAAGGTVAVVTDAGMPLVSDPGYRVVEAAIAAGVPVRCAPGPSAVLAALAVAGLPTDRFTFEGFMARKPGQRAAQCAELVTQPRTMVFFESARRTAACLTDMAAAFGGSRRAAVCRELTKIHEEVRRGTLAELVDWAQGRELLGEVVIVVAGAPPVAVGPEDVVGQVLDQVAAGVRLKDAVKEVAQQTGVSSRELYAAAVELRR